MNKPLSLLTALLSLMLVTAQPRKAPSAKFALVSGNSFQILADTLAYKQALLQLIDPENHIHLDKIQLIRQQTLGEKREWFYYILATDFEHQLKMAKWLVRKKNALYLDGQAQAPDIKALYLTCVGKGGCRPQVFVKKNVRSWSCSDQDKGCTLTPNTACQTFTSILLD